MSHFVEPFPGLLFLEEARSTIKSPSQYAADRRLGLSGIRDKGHPMVECHVH
jgi:hypothetical protein